MTIRGTNGYFGRNAFLGHLRTLPPNEIVGISHNPYHCPIATEIKRLVPNHNGASAGRYQIEYLVITHDGRHLGQDTHTHRSPQWVARFIAAIDDRARYGNVTAAEAIAALERIK